MLDLTREEKLVLIFITASFLIGSGVNFYKKHHREAEVTSSADLPSRPPRNNRIININTADLNGLITIRGIGIKTAERIIEYRQQHGPFFYKDDIMKVKGIGNSKYEAIEKSITTQ